MVNRTNGIDKTKYDESDGGHVIKAFTLIGVPTYKPVRWRDSKSKKGRLVHWRLHARWYKKRQQDYSSWNVAFDVKSRSGQTGDLEPKKRVKLCARSRRNLFSTSASETWQIDIPLKAGVRFTVEDTINFLGESKFARYRSDHQGRGCLTWCLDVIRGLRDDKDLIESTDVVDMERYVEAKRAEAEEDETEKYWIPYDQGSYDNPEAPDEDEDTKDEVKDYGDHESKNDSSHA